jgi:hypothetical protein
MKLDGSLPFFNVKDTPVDGSTKTRASHWQQADNGVIQTTDGQMRATPLLSTQEGQSKLPVAMSSENKNALKSALESIRDNIAAMFNSLTHSSNQAEQKADQFINSVMSKAQQSTEFELSLSSSASQFSSSTLVDPSAGTEYLEQQAWTNIRGLNINVDNINGEVSVDYSHVMIDISASESERIGEVNQSLHIAKQGTKQATGTDESLKRITSYQSSEVKASKESGVQKASVSTAIGSMNEASLRSLHAFMLTVTGVDGREIGNAMDRAHEEGRLPNSADRETYIAQWKELQNDSAFRHDITYDGRDELITKNKDLLADYFIQNQSSRTLVGIASASKLEHTSNQSITYDSIESVKSKSVSLILDFLSQYENSSLYNLRFDREQTSFSLDLAFYLGDFSHSQDGRVKLTLSDGNISEFGARQQSIDIKA